jgi:hypothetical protein
MYQNYSTPPSANDGWWLSDLGKTQGPFTWNDIVYNIQNRNITNKAQIKHDSWPYWAPISAYFHSQMLVNPEAEGIMPGRYDLMYYLGVGIFILGIFAYMANPILGLILFVCSIIIEIGAIYLERENKLPSKTAMLGNICAGIFIIVEIVVILIFISITI